MSADRNRDVAVKFLVEMGNGMDESVITSDFLWWAPAMGTVTKEALAAGVAQLKPLMPNLPEMKVVATTAEGDRVAIEMEGKCQLANGKRYDNKYHFLVEFKGDRIHRVREYCDTKLAADVFGG
jgi:ketosteroid isomerase-like protein